MTPEAGHSAGGDRLRVLRRVLAEPARYVRPWYIAYLLLGAATLGLLPVLLPLMIAALSTHLATVALVIGGYNLGLLTSPLWGMAAERWHAYRGIFFCGFAVCALATAVFPLLRSLATWLPSAFLVGVGAAGASTVAPLLIVDFAPPAEWEPRIGFLQSFSAIGQVIGLFLASLFSHGLYEIGLWIAAALLVPALVLSGRGLPIARRRRAPGEADLRQRLDARAMAVFPRTAHLVGIMRHAHRLNIAGMRNLPRTLGTPFAWFLLSWFSLCFGVSGFFTYFPLMLAKSDGIKPEISSSIYGLAAGGGILLFILASRWSERYGSLRVYQGGLVLRILGFVMLLVPFVVSFEARTALAAASFGIIVLAWPILSVSGTGLAARLTPFSQGAAMGLFNAALAGATVIGTLVSGPLVEKYGYAAIPAMALVGLAAAMTFGLRARQR